MDEKLERAQLMARFKLMVKRSLGESVDLERLARDLAYARSRLAEVEEAAQDEELLIMVLRLRDIFVPLEAPPLAEIGTEAGREIRSYKMGARSW
jgi:hypothetical protein